MHKLDYPFVRIGLQLLFNKVCSKMHGLPSRGLSASIRGYNMKNEPRKPRSGQIMKHYITHTPLMGAFYNFCFIQFSVKMHGLTRRGFPASGGQPEPGFFSNILHDRTIVST